MFDPRTIKVFSARDTDSEAGFEPFLEGVFLTREEAEAYVECWSSLYNTTQFWVEN